MPRLQTLENTENTWEHPLIRRPASAMTRRYMLGLAGGAATIAVLPPTSLAAQPATPDAATTTDITGETDAVALLRTAVQAMSTLETFHFIIETTEGETRLLDVLEIETIEGDVRRPFDFETTVSANLFMGSIEVTAVSVDGRVMIEDPTSVTGEWIDLGADTATLTFLNPDYLLLQAVGIVQDAALDGEEEFEGESARRVIGMVALADIAGDLTSDLGPLPAELATEPVELEIWINEQNLIRGIQFTGAVLSTEDADTERLITFSAFNEPVEIEAPDV